MRKFKTDKDEKPIAPKLAPYKKASYKNRWWEIDIQDDDNVLLDYLLDDDNQEDE